MNEIVCESFSSMARTREAMSLQKRKNMGSNRQAYSFNCCLSSIIVHLASRLFHWYPDIPTINITSLRSTLTAMVRALCTDIHREFKRATLMTMCQSEQLPKGPHSWPCVSQSNYQKGHTHDHVSVGAITTNLNRPQLNPAILIYVQCCHLLTIFGD